MSSRGNQKFWKLSLSRVLRLHGKGGRNNSRFVDASMAFHFYLKHSQAIKCFITIAFTTELSERIFVEFYFSQPSLHRLLPPLKLLLCCYWSSSQLFVYADRFKDDNKRRKLQALNGIECMDGIKQWENYLNWKF